MRMSQQLKEFATGSQATQTAPATMSQATILHAKSQATGKAALWKMDIGHMMRCLGGSIG